MKILLMIFFILFFISCSSPCSIKLDTRTPSFCFEVLENFLTKAPNKESILKLFSKPRAIFKDEKNPKEESWIYDHPIKGYQEWAFEFNENGETISTSYHPSGDSFPEFSLLNIEKRWANFKCEHKIKQILMPGLIKHIRYLTCANEKRYVEYNKYKEVWSITVEK